MDGNVPAERTSSGLWERRRTWKTVNGLWWQMFPRIQSEMVSVENANSWTCTHLLFSWRCWCWYCVLITAVFKHFNFSVVGFTTHTHTDESRDVAVNKSQLTAEWLTQLVCPCRHTLCYSGVSHTSRQNNGNVAAPHTRRLLLKTRVETESVACWRRLTWTSVLCVVCVVGRPHSYWSVCMSGFISGQKSQLCLRCSEAIKETVVVWNCEDLHERT